MHRQAIAGDDYCGYRINLGHTLEARRAPGDMKVSLTKNQVQQLINLQEALAQYEAESCAYHIRAQCDAFVTRQKICAWETSKDWAHDISHISTGVIETDRACVTPAMALFCEWERPQIELEVAKNFARTAEWNVRKLTKHEYKLEPATTAFLEALKAKAEPAETGRIRIGYISNYFYEHIVGYILENLLPLHDKKKFEVFAYGVNREKGK